MKFLTLWVLVFLFPDILCYKEHLKGSFYQTVSLVNYKAISLGLGFTKVTTRMEPEIFGLISNSKCEEEKEYKILSEPNDTYWPDMREVFQSINGIKALKLRRLRKTFVAVIDTGLDINHEDIGGRVNRDLAFDASNLLMDENSEGVFVDTIGHGTHVSGIIAANGFNNKGVIGVAKNAEIIPIKVASSSGKIYLSSVLIAYAYIALLIDLGYPIKIANASFGTDVFSQLEYEALRELQRRGVILVAAAGNSGKDLDNLATYPASHNLPNIISVASGFYNPRSKESRLSSFSNFGRKVTVIAPGENIISLFPENKYAAASGTSMATPIVSGSLALFFGLKPKAKDKIAIKALTDSCIKLPQLKNYSRNGCYLNINNLLTVAKQKSI